MHSTIIIMGSNGNLGSALVRLLAKNHSIIGIDKHKASTHSNIQYLSCNLAAPQHINKTLQLIPVLPHQKITLISTAGIFGEPSFESDIFHDEAFCESIDVNLLGPCRLISHLAARVLKTQASPKLKIIVVGSTGAHVGSLDLGYGVAKAGLNGFVRSISKALAPRGIICIGINPGIFESSMSRSVSQKRQKRAIDATHIKRIGQLEEVSQFIAHLALDAPDYLTGSIIQMNGGQYA